MTRLYRSQWAVVALVVLLSLLYFSSLTDMQWSTHDREYMIDSAAMGSDVSRLLATDKLMPGRPTLELVLWLWYSAWGDSPAAFHWLGIVLHAGASILLIYVGQKLGWGRSTSLVAGLLFLTHVGHFRAVHWVAAFCYQLVLIGGLVSILFAERYACQGRNKHLIGIYLLSILSMGSHASSVFVYPLVLLWLFGKRQAVGSALKLIPLGPLLAGCAWFIATYYKAAPQNAVIVDHFSLLDSTKALAALFSRLFTTAQSLPVSPFFYAGWEVGIALPLFIGLGLYAWKYDRSMLLWLAWIVLSLLPFLSVQVGAQGQLVAGPSGVSRYLYVSSAGSSFVLAVLAQRGVLYLSGQVGKGVARWIGVGVLLLALASSFVWLKRTEGISFYVSGRYYEASGERDLSAQQFRLALERGRSLVNGAEIYGRAYLPLLARGDAHEQWLAEGLNNYPDHSLLNVYRLVMQSMTGDEAATESLHRYKDSGARSQLIAIAYYNWAIGLSGEGNLQQAVLACQHSVDFVPGNIRAWVLWGVLTGALNREEEAQRIMKYARQLAADERAMAELVAEAERSLSQRRDRPR